MLLNKMAQRRRKWFLLALVLSLYIWSQLNLSPRSIDLSSSMFETGNQASRLSDSYDFWSFDQCMPRENVFFLRIHKTGGSIITTLLYRRALRHNLTMVLTRKHPHLLNSNVTMESLFTYPHDYEHAPANVFAGHAIFNATEAERLMPKDTLYIASVRNPLTHITSVLEEFDTVNFPMVQQTKWSNLTEYFLDNLEKYGPSMRMPTKSLMAQMFGVPDKDLDNLEVIDRALEYIDKQFALVIVMEYFDESLIVLRRKLCWEMADIVYLSQRVSHRPRDPVSDKNEEKYREWSYADFLIHHHFADKLWAQEIPKHSDFWDELHTLRKINKMITDYCKTVLEEFMTHDPYFILSTVRFLRETNYLALDPRPWGNPFYIRPADCVVMSLDTSVMRNIFKVRQIPKLCTLNNTQRIVPDSIISDIDWVGDKVELHPDYCLPPHPDYGFPLEILASKEAYLEPALIYWS